MIKTTTYSVPEQPSVQCVVNDEGVMRMEVDTGEHYTGTVVFHTPTDLYSFISHLQEIVVDWCKQTKGCQKT